MTKTRRSILRAAKAISIIAFVFALIDLFVFGNYLMIQDHRPYQEILSRGFIYPIPGKGGYIYVSKSDLAILAGLILLAAIGAKCASLFNRANN